MDQQPDSPKKPSLRDMLKSKTTPTAATPTLAAPAPLSEVIRHTFSMMAQIERTAQSVIAEALLPLTGGQDRRNTQRAIQTLMSLSPMDQPKEDWEQAAHIDIVQGLRERIAGRVISLNRRTFERSSSEELDRIIRSMTTFRAASKRTESILSEREGIVPGPRRMNRASQNRAREGEIPQELEEIIFALAQFRLSAEKAVRPKLADDRLTHLRDLNKSLQEVKSTQKIDLPEAIEAPVEGEAREAFIKIVSQIFESMGLDEATINTLENETALFGSSVEDVGTDIASLHGIQHEEFGAVRQLEAMYDLWSSTKAPSHKADASEEEIQLAVFHALKGAAPNLGKAVTMNMVSKLAGNHEWLQKFREEGTEAIHQAREIRNHVVLTEPESKLFGEPTNVQDYLAEGSALTEALTLVDLAESILYSSSVTAALSDRNRGSALFCAQKVISGEATPEEIQTRPMMAAMDRTHKKALGLTNAVFKEVDGREKNLAMLPAALREREQVTRVENSIVRLIQTFSDPKVKATIGQLLATEQDNLDQLGAPQNEAEAKAKTFCQEKLATLQAMSDLGEGADTLDEAGFQTLLRVVTAEEVPKTLRQHALVTLCDNKSKTGVKIKTKEVLDRMENLCEVPHLAGKTRRDLGTLRQWKEKEMLPSPIDKTELGKAICAMPVEIKRLIGEELSDALKSCLQASPWQPPAQDPEKKLAVCRQNIYVLRKEYQDEPNTLAALEDLHQTTDGMLAGTTSTFVAKVKLADAFADQKNSLHKKENRLINAILQSKKPQGALRYMAAWYNLVGNQRTLRQETGMQREWKLDPLPLAGARMQSRIENLLQIGAYARAVATQPESLAEAYLQHEMQERRGGKDRWDIRVDRMIAKTESGIERAEAELEDWEQKYNSMFDDSDLEEDDLSREERENETRLKTTCQRKLGQKTRELENLFLKKERLIELKDTARALNNGAEEVEQVLETLGNEEPQSGEFVNVGTAWEMALANLAKSAAPINLPSTPKGRDVTVYQILEGAALTDSLRKATDLLRRASKMMAPFQPEADDIGQRIDKLEEETLSERDPADKSMPATSEIENPQEIAKELKKTAFRAMKDVEVRLWEKGKSIDLAEEEIEAFLEENPELVANRKEWVDTLKKTLKTLVPGQELAKTLEKKKPSKDKDMEPAFS